MEVKKLDIFESIIVGFVSFSYIRSIFTVTGTLPCVLFSVGIAAIFLIFYHEKYIGVILNIGVSLLWTVLLTTLISLFSLFNGRVLFLIPIAVAIFYVSLCIHGLSIHDLISGGENHIKTSDKIIQHPFNDFRTEYDRFGKLKEQILPIFEQVLSDPNADEGIKATISKYYTEMDGAEEINKNFLKIAKKRRISLKEFNTVVEWGKQIADMNATLQESVDAFHSDGSGSEENREYQYQGGHQSGNDTTSYFNGCDTFESIKTRYRALCKVYHPDMGNGSPEEFDKIQKEYNELKEKFSNGNERQDHI